MSLKKVLIISLILMFLLMPVAFADDGDYSIPSAIKDVTVKDDGSVVIIEKIVYDVDGTINGVYRDIPLEDYQSITNVSVETPGYYNNLKVIEKDDRTRIKVWLYSDPQKTRKTRNAKVEVTYTYTFNKGVKIYNDIAELQYMTWGDEWDSGVSYLESNIHIPGSNQNTEYWDNPTDYLVSSEWTSDNTLTTVSESLGSHSSYEQRILMPTSYFKSSENAQVINIDAKQQIEADQKKYQENRDFQNSIISFATGILGVLMIIPAGIYALFGREPKIDYKADYEYDFPTDATPIQVNSIVVGDVDEIDNNGIYATILDLIHNKYLKVISTNTDDTIIRQTDKDTSNLKDYEKSLLSYLSKFSINSDISLKSIGDTEDPTTYIDFKNTWIKEAKQEVPDSLIEKYFNKKGSRYYTILATVFLILSMIIFIGSAFLDVSFDRFMVILAISVVLFIESIIMSIIPNTFAGRWTPEGKEFHDKWKNFEKYIKDYSLISERPPASIEVWGKYIVYAAALGCAKEVSENMEKYFKMKQLSQDYISNSDILFFAYYGGFNHMDSSFSSLTKSSSSSGGIGSVGGGGFGGGGGGTF